MKKDKLYLILAILCVWTPMFMGVWNKAKPASSTSLRSSNPEILANWVAIEAALGQDHEFSTGGTNSGNHEVLTMEEEASAGASSTDEGHLQVIDGGSQPEMAYTSEDGDELQFTKDGDLYSSDNLVVDGTSTLTGAIGAAASITLGAGADLIGSSTSDITFNTNKFTVAGDTGNTLIAGTLDVTGATEITGVATLGDGSLLKTSAAPSTDAMIANKKYVDDTTAFADYDATNPKNDSEGNEMLKAHAYLAATDGFVSVQAVLGAAQLLSGFVDDTSNPAGAGIKVQESESDAAGQSRSIFLVVAAGEHFEITSGANDASINIYWKSIGTESKPEDQD